MALPKPETRLEQYLSNIANGTGGTPPYPITRIEQYLDAIAKGGGTGEGDMKKSVYDPDLNVRDAGGIEAYVNAKLTPDENGYINI